MIIKGVLLNKKAQKKKDELNFVMFHFDLYNLKKDKHEICMIPTKIENSHR